MRHKRSLTGFTLIELVIVITILGIISVVIGRTLFQSLQSFLTAQNISRSDWQSFLLSNRFTSDVHRIRSSNDVLAITSTQFSFIDISGNTVTYQLSGSTVLRNGLTLAANVTSLGFSYYDANYVTTAIPLNVRYISLASTFTENNLSLSYSTMAGTRGMS